MEITFVRKLIRMKMKLKIFCAVLGLSSMLISCSDNDTDNKLPENTAIIESQITSEYTVNTDNSIVEWGAELLGIYTHRGTLKFKSGSFAMSENNVVAGTFTVDMESIAAVDGPENYKYGTKEELITHLKSADFFEVEEFGTASLKMEGLVEVDEYREPMMSAQLTIKDVTNSVYIRMISSNFSASGVEVKAIVKLNRQDFGIDYKEESKDLVISDEIMLEIVIVGDAK